MKKTIFFIFISIFLLIASLASAQETNLFVSGANVRIRADGTTSGKVVATLPLGTYAEILETGSKQQKLVGKTDFWYKIRDDKGNEGWIFGGLTIRCSADQKFEKASTLINERLTLDGKPLEEAEQLYAFAKEMVKQASADNDKAMMELGRLQALQNILNTLSSMGKGSDDTHPAIKENKDIIYAHESAGQNYVHPDAFWAIAEKYKAVPAADIIAWNAAQQQLPGETEGDPVAVLSLVCATDIKYLKMFPDGQSIGKALEHIKWSIDEMPGSLNKEYFSGEYGEEARKSFLADLATLENTLQACANKEAVYAILEVTAKLKEIAKK